VLARLMRPATAVFAAAVFSLAWQPTALAGGGPGSGGPFSSVACGQGYSPSCSVTAGSPGTSASGHDGGPLAAASAPGCAGSQSSQFGCVPAGCSVTVATLACPVGVTGAAFRQAQLPAPGVLALIARSYLVLPSPVIRSSPAPGDLQLVDLPVWLWVSPAMWAARSATATVPGEQVTATATPVNVAWHMGDGSTIVCHGPGTPYSSRYSPSSASPDCGHIYRVSSAGQPGSVYHVVATITWQVTWQATGGTGGVLPPLFSTSAAVFQVAESQAVNTAGGSR
jgi:hypothetical protein